MFVRIYNSLFIIMYNTIIVRITRYFQFSIFFYNAPSFLKCEFILLCFNFLKLLLDKKKKKNEKSHFKYAILLF